jgi:hypothetical protein
MHTQKGPTKTKWGIHRPGGSCRSSARDWNLHSLVQGLLARPHMNVQAHAGTTLLQVGEHISVSLGVVGKGSLAASIGY